MPRLRRALGGVLLGFSVLALGGCAYFNTFYYARSQYKVAFPQTRDAYLAPSVTGPQAAALDSSLVRSRKLIVRYRHSRWVDDAYLLAGKAYYGRGRYDDAISQLEAMLDSFPKSPLRAEATTFLGAAYVRSGKSEKGRAILEGALRDFAKFSHRDYTLFLLAESYRVEKRYAEALPHYEEIASSMKSSDVRDEAALQAGLALARLGRYEEARASLARVGRRKVSADLRRQALMTIGDTYLEEKTYPEAERAFHAVIDDVADPQGAGKTDVAIARIRVAEAQAGRSRYADAIKTLEGVIADTPHTPQAAEAQYQIGYIHEVRRGDVPAARTAYAKVREIAAGSQFATRAEARARNLERLSTLRIQGGRDPAEAAFTEAELVLLDLEKPEDALARYATVRRRYPHSDFAPKSAFAIAWTRLHALRDTAGARGAFGDLLRRYPETVYAEDARYALARLGVASPDSTPLVIDELALARDSVAVTDSLAPFEASADSLARVLAAADSLLARVRADSLARAAALRDSVARALARRDSLARAGTRPPGSQPHPRASDLEAADNARHGSPGAPGGPPGADGGPPSPSAPGLLPPVPPPDTTRSRTP